MYYLAFDCETTGLTPNCNVLTAYFIILDNHLNKIDELDLKIKHDFYNVYTKALEINKIDLIEHDKTSISIQNSNQLLLKFLEKNFNNKKYTIIGHNISFDIKMILSNKLITNDDFNKYFITEYYSDTYSICKELKKLQKINKCQSLSLNKLCNYFNIKLNETDETDETNICFHNARYDTLCTIQLYKKIKEIY